MDKNLERSLSKKIQGMGNKQMKNIKHRQKLGKKKVRYYHTPIIINGLTDRERDTEGNKWLIMFQLEAEKS